MLAIYTDKLLKEGVITEAFATEVRRNMKITFFAPKCLNIFSVQIFLLLQETQRYWDYCETEFEKAKTIDTMQLGDWHDVPWTDFFANQSPQNPIPPTGIDLETMLAICKAISTPPADILPHPQVRNY